MHILWCHPLLYPMFTPSTLRPLALIVTSFVGILLSPEWGEGITTNAWSNIIQVNIWSSFYGVHPFFLCGFVSKTSLQYFHCMTWKVLIEERLSIITVLEFYDCAAAKNMNTTVDFSPGIRYILTRLIASRRKTSYLYNLKCLIKNVKQYLVTFTWRRKVTIYIHSRSLTQNIQVLYCKICTVHIVTIFLSF